jgi:hypothetical protein
MIVLLITSSSQVSCRHNFGAYRFVSYELHHWSLQRSLSEYPMNKLRGLWDQNRRREREDL